MADFIIQTIERKPEPLASFLIENLVQAFPAFNDKATYDGKEIFLYKKVQLLCADLHRRFGNEDKRFNFKDVDQLTVFTDNVVPAVLRKMGMMKLSEKFAQRIDEGKTLPPGPQEIELRAIAIQVSDEIVRKGREKFKDNLEISSLFNSIHLDYYLWMTGKDPEFRKVERHYTKDTVYY